MDTEARQALLRRRLLGSGLRLVPVGDLGRDLALDAAGRDLALETGVENLAQALAVAVLTPLGGDPLDTGFGFDGLNALVEETAPLLQRERVRVAIVTLLRRDPRVGAIVDVRLVDGRLEQPSTGAARLLDVRVVFETVTGDALALTAGRAGARLARA